MEVRRAKTEDIPSIVYLAKPYVGQLMPYIHDLVEVEKYIESFYVAYDSRGIVGALHCSLPTLDRDIQFLLDVKLVPDSIIEDFSTGKGSQLFISHVVCPGRGSFGTIIRSLKKDYTDLLCFLSVNSPAMPSYRRHGFWFTATIPIYNKYKKGTSDCQLGYWPDRRGIGDS